MSDTIEHTGGPTELEHGPLAHTLVGHNSGGREAVEVCSWDQREGCSMAPNGGDALLITRYREVPHECSDPECPGKQNKFQLDNYAEMLGTLRDSEKQFDALVETVAERQEQLAASREELDAAKAIAPGLSQTIKMLRADLDVALKELASALTEGDRLRKACEVARECLEHGHPPEVPLLAVKAALAPEEKT